MVNENTIKAILISFGLFAIIFVILIQDQLTIDTATLFALIIALIGFEVKQSYEIGYVKAKIERLGFEVEELVNKVFKK